VAHDSLEGMVDDSKKLSLAQRQVIAQLIKEQTTVGIGWASAAYIDQHGMTAALKYAAVQAIACINLPIDLILLDGNSNFIADSRVKTIIGGDAVEPVIAAASIIAKVARDTYMSVLGQSKFIGYGFEAHVGYGTQGHQAALAELGPSALHRLSFAPLQKMITAAD
jgi:ribonuclease HII